MVVTDPVVRTVVVASGLATDPCVESNVVGALFEKTFCPLKLVVWRGLHSVNGYSTLLYRAYTHGFLGRQR